MMTDHRAQLVRIASTVFEEQAFMFSDELVQPGEAPAGLLETTMSFAGPRRGRLMMAAPHALALLAAANMLGLEPEEEPAREQAVDALMELLNVICGHLATEIFGTEAVVRMTVPAAQAIEPGRWGELAGGSATARLLVDEQPVLLALELDGG